MKVNRKTLLRAAKDLNKTLGLNPEIDLELPDKELLQEILDAGGEVTPSDEVSEDTRAFLIEQGAVEAPKKKAKKPVADEDDEDEDEAPKKKAKKPAADEDEDEDEADEDEEADEEADEDDDDEEPAPKKKAVKKLAADEDDEDDEADEDDEEPAPKKKAVKKPAADEDEDEPEVPQTAAAVAVALLKKGDSDVATLAAKLSKKTGMAGSLAVAVTMQVMGTLATVGTVSISKKGVLTYNE
jgi:hypothetical protein